MALPLLTPPCNGPGHPHSPSGCACYRNATRAAVWPKAPISRLLGAVHSQFPRVMEEGSALGDHRRPRDQGSTHCFTVLTDMGLNGQPSRLWAAWQEERKHRPQVGHWETHKRGSHGCFRSPTKKYAAHCQHSGHLVQERTLHFRAVPPPHVTCQSLRVAPSTDMGAESEATADLCSPLHQALSLPLPFFLFFNPHYSCHAPPPPPKAGCWGAQAPRARLWSRPVRCLRHPESSLHLPRAPAAQLTHGGRPPGSDPHWGLLLAAVIHRVSFKSGRRGFWEAAYLIQSYKQALRKTNNALPHLSGLTGTRSRTKDIYIPSAYLLSRGTLCRPDTD